MLSSDFRCDVAEIGAHQSSFECELRGAGTTSKIFFRASEPILEPSREFSVACSLLPAMAEAAGVEVEGPTSAKLVSALPSIVDILVAWNPQLTRVSFPALTPIANRRSSPGRVGAFFSGGADAFYTFLKNRDEVTDIIFVHGFESSHGNEALLRKAVAGVEAVAAAFGVGVVLIETNLKPVLSTFVDWGQIGHGTGLATVGHLLSPAFERIYIGSSVHYCDLFPWGSHPLFDPLWSSEELEIVHHGCEARRIDKIEFIAGFEAALANLRVCHWGPGTTFESDGAVNCGRCEKCIRTMVALEAAGKLSQCTSFDRPLECSKVAKVHVDAKIRAFYVENLEALRRQGVRPDLQRAVERRLRRPYLLKRLEKRVRHALRGTGRSQA